MRTALPALLVLVALGCDRGASASPPTRVPAPSDDARAVPAPGPSVRPTRAAGPSPAPPRNGAALPCAAPMNRDDACRCLLAALPPGDGARACEVSETGVPGFALVRHATPNFGEEQVHVLAQQPGGAWSVVALLADVFNPGAMGMSEEWSLQSASERMLGERAIVELVGHAVSNDIDMGLDEAESAERETLMVCLRSSGATPATCPLEVVRSHRYERDVLGMDEDLDPALHTKGLPIRSAFELGVELGPDGVARIRALSGQPDPAQLGDRRLW